MRALLSALSSRKEEELLFSYERSIKWTRQGGWLSFPGQLFYKRSRTRHYLTNVLIRVGESKSWCTHWLEFTKTFFICCKSWSKFVLVPNNCFLVFFLLVCLFVIFIFNSHSTTVKLLYVSGNLHNYPSPKPTLTLTSHLGQNVGLGEG